MNGAERTRTLGGREALAEILRGETVTELLLAWCGDRPPNTEWEWRMSMHGSSMERRRCPDGQWETLFRSPDCEVGAFINRASLWRVQGEDDYRPFSEALEAMMQGKAVQCRCDSHEVWFMMDGRMMRTHSECFQPRERVPDQAMMALGWRVLSDGEFEEAKRMRQPCFVLGPGERYI